MYHRPELQQRDLTTATASCTPAPEEWCQDRQGFVKVGDDAYVGVQRTYIAGQCFAYPQKVGDTAVMWRGDGYLVQIGDLF